MYPSSSQSRKPVLPHVWLAYSPSQAPVAYSNGFSLIRKLLEVGSADLVRDTLSDGSKAIDHVLAPTRLYVPAVKAMLKAGMTVHGYSHITGGGMFDNIERILPDGLAATVDISAWPVPPVFEYLLSFADVARDERYRTFNMGIGFVVILPQTEADAAEAVLRDAGETVFRIGHIHQHQGERVTLQG